jgi:hypothetical protein
MGCKEISSPDGGRVGAFFAVSRPGEGRGEGEFLSYATFRPLGLSRSINAESKA